MLLMELKMTADPARVEQLKEANDVTTPWATVELIINGTPVERREFNLNDVLEVLTDGVRTGAITVNEGVVKFNQLTERGETVISHLDALGSVDDSPTAKLLMFCGNLTETGKNMTEDERLGYLAEHVFGQILDGLDVIDTDSADTDGKEG